MEENYTTETEVLLRYLTLRASAAESQRRDSEEIRRVNLESIEMLVLARDNGLALNLMAS